jgi:hypothetical protein
MLDSLLARYVSSISFLLACFIRMSSLATVGTETDNIYMHVNVKEEVTEDLYMQAGLHAYI